jgi:HlyD family secretion protein
LRRILTVVALLAVAALLFWAFSRRTAPPEIPFAKVTRETLTSSIPTNGKVEPLESAMVRAEREGTVVRVLVHEGQPVRQGAVILELDAKDARADLSAAEARIAQARAQLETLNRGGRSVELAEIESGIQTNRQQLRVAEQDLATEQRLLERKATTVQAVTNARDRVDRLRLELESLERRRGALVSPADKSAAEARIREAQASATLAQHRIDLSRIAAPQDGILYQFRTEPDRNEIRVGTYLQPGALIGRIGKLDRLRVRVFVDEPELGRVARGMPVLIAWEARRGRQWKGVVEKVPTEVTPLGTRQVGEIEAIIDNPDGELPPGANVDAEIVSRVVSNALTVPKEALHRQNEQDAVWLLRADGSNTLEERKVKLGSVSVARAEVLEGLKEGDAVALPVDRTFKPGDKVTPIWP